MKLLVDFFEMPRDWHLTLYFIQCYNSTTTIFNVFVSLAKNINHLW